MQIQLNTFRTTPNSERPSRHGFNWKGRLNLPTQQYKPNYALSANRYNQRNINFKGGINAPAYTTKEAIRIYLEEIGRLPMLTHEQELALGRKIQKGKKTFDKVIQTLTERLLITPQELIWEKLRPKQAMILKIKETPEIATIKQGLIERFSTPKQRALLKSGKIAQEKLTEANLRLVVSVGKKFMNYGLPFMDIIQEGNLGLMVATEKFDPTMGYKFSTYATWWIRQAISLALKTKGSIIKIPAHVREDRRLLEKIRQQLMQKDLGMPNEDDLIAAAAKVITKKAATGIKETTAKSALRAPVAPVSFDTPIDED